MATQQTDVEFEQLLDYIKDERGFDFTGYKRPTLMRRIGKRMAEVKVDSPEAYREILAANDDEFVHLFNTILINVTGFFRDAPAWDYIREDVLPRILEAREDGEIRVWSTGCATGEEAFTAAIGFAEAMGEDEFRERVKIYATDVDDEALRDARHASYSAEQIEPVPEELRGRYFDRVDSRFAFRADLRRNVIFGRHDLIQDPPISRIDLLISRNTLMYFSAATQTRILENFHFALREGGFLFLGKSEVLLTRSSLFTPLNLKRRVFTKVPLRLERPRAVPRADPAVLAAAASTDDAAESARAAMFDTVPSAHLVVDDGGALILANLQARSMFGIGRSDVGRPLRDLELSYRPLELRSRIDEALERRQKVTTREVEWRRNDGDTKYLDVQVIPLVDVRGHHRGVGITFTDVTRFRGLHDELELAKREVENAYEELQATVEELETTNEELQSTNEELETMNDELETRTRELDSINLFLESILGSLQTAVIAVDGQFRVEAWNQRAFELWGLHADEVQGQPLMTLDIGLPVGDLAKPLRAAVAGERQEVELRARDRRGRDVRLRVTCTPLMGIGGPIRGAIVLMEPIE